MSNSPETDAAITDWSATDESCVYAEFARKLERERDEARAVAVHLADNGWHKWRDECICKACKKTRAFLARMDANYSGILPACRP